ncbi:MAG: helix-turn-helix domain-containing protein [Pseudonocardiaceae bacterium]
MSRIERGARSPTLTELVALADALQISMSELTRLPVPAPTNGHTDELPGLVRDLHTTLATGADHGELLELAVYLEHPFPYGRSHHWVGFGQELREPMPIQSGVTVPLQLSARTRAWLADRPQTRKLVRAIWDELAELGLQGFFTRPPVGPAGEQKAGRHAVRTSP